MNTLAWVIVVVIVAALGATQQRPLGAELAPEFSEVEAAVIVADLVSVMEKDWPAAHTRLAIVEDSSLPIALEARLRGAGYALATGEGQHERVLLEADRIGGLGAYRVGLRVGAGWQLDRRYDRDASGRLRAAGGYSLRGGRGVRGPLPAPGYEVRAEQRAASAVEVQRSWHVELDRESAEAGLEGRRMELERLGIPALVVNEGSAYRLRAGPFRDLSRARGVLELLQVSGYATAALVDVTESRMVRGAAADGGEGEGEAERCADVRIEAGSLRVNAARLLEECGYRLGRWELGVPGELEDLIIPVAYELRIEGEVWGLLAFLEEAYGVRARVRELDGAVDFESAEDGA